MNSEYTCAVIGCHNNNSKKVKVCSETVCVTHQQLRIECPCPPPYYLHTMPVKEEERKLAWLGALRLKHPPERVYVCSSHFVDRKPTEEHPDPELYLGYENNRDAEEGMNYMINSSSTALDITGVSSSAHPSDPQFGSAPTWCEDPALHDHDYCKASPNEKTVTNTVTPCDEVGIFMLQSDSDALLHTGLNLTVFNILLSTLEKYASCAFFRMSVRDQVLMTLMKLKTNSAIGVLSRQFNVSQIMANKVILYWIDKLEEVLLPLVPWLPRETIKATMPESFKKMYPNTTCILHCSVSRLQKPPEKNVPNNVTRGASYSHYYNPVKYLVAVAPCGLVMFISAAYSMHCTDKFIASDSGILDHLMPGDEVMVEQSSTMKDLRFIDRKIKLITPSFTAVEHSCSCTCIEHSGPKAHVRVHVEKAVKRLKVYKILSQVVGYSLTPKISKILRICSALVNLRMDPIHDSH